MNKDVLRTFQERELFEEEDTQNHLKNILQTWALNHKKMGYRQGMSDVVGILFELCHIHLESVQSVLEDAGEEFKTVNNSDFIEHDVYVMFDLILSAGLKEFYVFEEPGKKKKKRSTTKMFGRPQFSNVRTLKS